jgi:hypothetical protein
VTPEKMLQTVEGVEHLGLKGKIVPEGNGAPTS